MQRHIRHEIQSRCSGSGMVRHSDRNLAERGLLGSDGASGTEVDEESGGDGLKADFDRVWHVGPRVEQQAQVLAMSLTAAFSGAPQRTNASGS